MKAKLIGLCAVLTLIAGCDRGGDQGNHSANASATAEGKAEEGSVTVKAPGVDISVRIPEGLRDRMATGANSAMLPSGVQIRGVHVQGNRQEGGSGGDGSVELNFASDQPPEQLARWYRDPARAAQFSIGTDAREGAAFVLGGTTRENGGRFTVRLAPRQGGGTDGRLILADRS